MCIGRCGAFGLAAETAEAAFHLAHEIFVLQPAGGDNDHAVCRVLAFEKAPKLIRGKGLDRLGGSEHRTAKRLVAERRLGETVEDDVVWNVVRGADFLENHMLLAFQLVRVELGIGQNVGKEFYRQRHVCAENACIECGCLDAGRSVDLTADILDIGRNLTGTAFGRSLERHVLQKMRNTVLILILIARSGFNPDAQRNGFQMRQGFGCDRQAVRQTAYLNTHMLLTP